MLFICCFIFLFLFELSENSSRLFVSDAKDLRIDELIKYGQSLTKNIKLQESIMIRNESGTDDVHCSMLYEGLPDEIKEVATKELKETEEKRVKGMKRLREFLKNENLNAVDDTALLFVLRSCKFDLKKSEAKLKKFCLALEKTYQKIADMDWNTIELIIEDSSFGFLPYRDRNGRAIMYSVPASNPDIFDKLDEMMHLSIATSVFLLSVSPISSVAGVSYIVDHNEIPTRILYSLPKAVGNHTTTWFSLPLRYGRVDVINEHFFSRLLFRIIKPFLSSKFSDRMMFHGGNIKYLHQLYPPEILPKEFGGKMASIRQNFFKEEALSFLKKIREIYNTTRTNN